MSGLLALLDDVAAIAKLAASSVDDVAGMAAKAGSKAAGVVIDDAAVTPSYVDGFDAKRELPMIWRITKGSLFNKLVILLPAAMLMNSFAPWLITPLLMLGGLYLSFEGAEKVFHWLFPHGDSHVEADLATGDPAHLEEERVKGAIKTDFILSAEIMTITLAAIPAGAVWMQAASLALVAIAITFVVYGSVALIVKMDDVGLFMAARARTGTGRAIGRGLVTGMPKLMTTLSIVGTAAMLWVGGSILVHGTHDLGWDLAYDTIHHWAELAAQEGFLNWLATATMDGLVGLAVGMVMIPIGTRIIGPLLRGKAAH